MGWLMETVWRLDDCTERDFLTEGFLVVVFSEVHRRLVETGSLSYAARARPVGRNVEFEEQVLQEVEENPSTSTRAVSRVTGTNHVAVWRVMKEQLLYPYHIQKVQQLHPTDYGLRVEFCHFIARRRRGNPDFHSSTYFIYG
ncbi:hypothetical protein PPYR_02710 [Photinus pyralis]|uniref:Uncharacterized protein n=1 Tax=Photinus pyralis TaxID=7054 RepID=A0A5N4A0R5_PHOPY|nr:hypothetical protein PPYR_02710 [Photinus pyralis]